MTKPKTSERCTDGVRAESLKNRWFLAVRDVCASKLASFSQWLCVLHFIETGCLNSANQTRGVACLTMCAREVDRRIF